MSTALHGGFTQFELDYLVLWGARMGIEVVVVPGGPHSGEENAYIGLDDHGAIWALYRVAGHLWLHRLDRVLWARNVNSVEEAIARIGGEIGSAEQKACP